LFTVAANFNSAFELPLYDVRKGAIELSHEFSLIDVPTVVSADKQCIEPLSARQTTDVCRDNVILTAFHWLIHN